MIALIGAGNMGFAMLVSWLSQGFEVSVFEPKPSQKLLELAKTATFVLNPKQVDNVEVVVLAVKPDKVFEVLAANKELFSKDVLLISIAAGIGVEKLLSAGQSKAVIRAMPNLPALIGEGFVVLYASPHCSEAQKVRGEKLMAALGDTEFLLEENLMDQATVLSGCGPAYLFYLAEILVSSGVDLGLDKTFATKAVIKTIFGAAQLLANNGSAETLRRQVTSPNGVTEASFEVLLKDEILKKVFAKAFDAALIRAKNLGR